MWYAWITLLLVSRALAAEVGAGAEAPLPVATTRAPPRTLDRQAAELAWRSWLQSPESGNQNAPPRRITTKSLFITPLVCPKGQRLDRNGCVQVVTVNKEEHERILLDQLNALFTSAPSGDVVYDYGDEEPGPLQLSIPIGFDPQAAPLQGQELTAQAQELQPSYVKVDKKDENNTNADASIEAELELLKLQNSRDTRNDTVSSDGTNILNHNVLSNLLTFSDKPKRDSPVVNTTVIESLNTTDQGQKEVVFGQISIDPILFNGDAQEKDTKPVVTNASPAMTSSETVINESTISVNKTSPNIYNATLMESASNSSTQMLKKDQTKLNPENDYSDIGEAIKLISRFAEVTTDDNFTKDENKYAKDGDSILGTRTKLQYRKTKLDNAAKDTNNKVSPEKLPLRLHPENEPYYRYPWLGQNSPTPPPNYPFRHLQDYWPGRNQIGGVYNTAHENPRRHHHSYPHSNIRLHGYPYYSGPYAGLPEGMQIQGYPHRVIAHHAPIRPNTNNQDLYSLLGLRHWFSSEGASKR